jgi:eukaryotic-like serine/threonine-protein kinase
MLPLVRDALADRYQVERELGRGGAARVFLARAPEGHLVALKVLHPELQVTVQAERFLREVRLVSQVDHPRIGRVLDAGERGWLVYYVMPYVEGPTLRHLLDRQRRLEEEDVRRLADELLDALGHAHRHGIVHRDVKPENIILGTEGAVLVDFGIARAVEAAGSDRVTRSGVAVGTSSYMSPEQIGATQELDGRADLYALGCVLYEALAGRPPFVHPHEPVVLTLHLTQPPPDLLQLRPGLEPLLAETVRRALEKNPENRWADADAMRTALVSRPTPHPG